MVQIATTNLITEEETMDLEIKELKVVLEDMKHELVSRINKPREVKEILSLREVMELLAISRRTLFRYRQQGLINTYQLKPKSKIYFKYSEIMSALNRVQEVA